MGRQLDLKKNPHEDEATRFPLRMYLWIGIAQCVADDFRVLSRSEPAIVAAMLLGATAFRRRNFRFYWHSRHVGASPYDFYRQTAARMTHDHLGHQSDRIPC